MPPREPSSANDLLPTVWSGGLDSEEAGERLDERGATPGVIRSNTRQYGFSAVPPKDHLDY